MKLYVDPGVHACGAALFYENGELFAAALPQGPDFTRVDATCRSKVWTGMANSVFAWALSQGEVRSVFIEFPRVRDKRTQTTKKRGTDPNDLLELAAVAGAIAREFDRIPTIISLPEEWKGTMPKEVMHARAWGQDGIEGTGLLTPAERLRIPKLPKSKLHNVLDAICMGLVFHGRLRTGGHVFDGNPARAK